MWAKLVIEGDRVVVLHPKVKDPVAVKYAGPENPEGANLYNRYGFPALTLT